MALTRWNFAELDKQTVKRVSEELEISILTAFALVSRGVVCRDTARRFLLHEVEIESPSKLKDIEIAVERINKAIERNERIAVFGDYDVDGIMSTAMVYQYLESVGADVIALLPERDLGGYGLAVTSVDEMRSVDTSLIITVDNGVSSHEAIEYASSLNIDTIVCDHHRIPEVLPSAVAVINPLREDDESSFKKLAGVGVALKLISAVEGCTVEEMLDIYGEFAAIGTIADVVPLIDENRIIVKRGLEQLYEQQNLGLSALLEETNLTDKKITAQDTAFTLIPRINAAGRMSSSKKALDMLISDDYEVVKELARELSEYNCMRQKVELEMLENIYTEIEENPSILNAPILVIYGEEYNAGVSGIVCSKLADRYGKPSLVISVDKYEAKGSARSIEGFSLYDAIASCSDLLKSFGGHDMAAGFTLESGNIKEFKQRLLEYCIKREQLMPCKSISVCCEIAFSIIDEKGVKELDKLAPFGTANEEPVFFTSGVTLKMIEALSDKHSRLTFEHNGNSLRAALFQVTPDNLCFKIGDKVDIAYVLSLFTSSNGMVYVSARLKSIVPFGFSTQSYEGVKIFEGLIFGKPITKEQKKQINPDREDIAIIYRSIKEQPILDDNNEQICYRFPEKDPGKVLAAVAILKELNLLTIEKRDNRREIVVSTNPVKRELQDSEIFTMLNL